MPPPPLQLPLGIMLPANVNNMHALQRKMNYISFDIVNACISALNFMICCIFFCFVLFLSSFGYTERVSERIETEMKMKRKNALCR